MKIIINGAEIHVTSIYEDNQYDGMASRPALHIITDNPLTAEQTAALINAPIDVLDDTGTLYNTIQPYDMFLSCAMVLARKSPMELELEAVKAERDALLEDKTALKDQVLEMGGIPVNPKF